MTIGDRIKTWRLKRKMSVVELSRRAKIAATTLYDLERGDSKSTTKLHMVAAALRINVHWLETGKGEPESDITPENQPLEGWPFKFKPSKFDDVSAENVELIEHMVLSMLEKMQPPVAERKKKLP